MRTLLLAIATMVMVAGCSAQAANPDVEVLTPEALDAAVSAAAQLLLDSPGIEASRLGYDASGELQLTAWLDWRANGDATALSFGRSDSNGSARVGNTTIHIGNRVIDGGVETLEVWTMTNSPPTDSSVLGAHDMAAGSTLDGLADVQAEVFIERKPVTDGGDLFRMVSPYGDGTVTQEWLIDAVGHLRRWSWETSPGLIVSSDSRVETHFAPLADPRPIVLPQEGSQLNPSLLGFPADLPTP